MKILCWNIAGIRASLKRGDFDFLIDSDYDVICIQETKATHEQGEKALSESLKENIFGEHGIVQKVQLREGLVEQDGLVKDL